MPPVEFEPTISASERPKTYALDGAATGTGNNNSCTIDILIYLLTAIGLSPGGSRRVHIYTQTIHRTTQNKQYIKQNNNVGRVRAV